MSRYMLFDANAEYTDEHGEPCSFGDHLKYVRNYMGTPDMWDSFDSLSDAVMAAHESGMRMVLVDERRNHEVLETIEPE